MKKAIYISILFLLVHGCTEKKNPLVGGKWIEIDNFINPQICSFSEDYISYNTFSFLNKSLYKIKADTLIFQGDFRMIKSRFRIKENTLELYADSSDSIRASFAKFEHQNILEFFNQRLNTTIELPNLPAKELNLRSIQNAFFCEYDDQGHLKLYRNGEPYTISNRSFIQLIPTDDYGTQILSALYCDKDVKIRDLNIIKSELQKATLLKMICLSQSKGELNNFIISIPYTTSYLPDSSFNTEYPPPPPPPPTFELTSWSKKDLLCVVDKEGILVNNKPISEEDLSHLISNQMNLKGFIIHLYFDEELLYEDYLKKMSFIRNIFYEARNTYSKEKFDKANYKELEHDKSREVSRKFPMRIREINQAELQAIHLMLPSNNPKEN